MATENDDSRSMNGILSNISRDVVDTSWDIPPLTFPKLQPTDSEEADGADGASLAEPRTIASSVPAQTEQPVSAAPTIADIPSMPLDTIDFDDAVAPADAEETATLPPLVSSTDEQDVEATQAFDTSDGITDLEELAAEDPEHDPLKTIPVAPKEPSADKWKIIAIVAAIAAVAVAIAGVIVVRNRINSKEQRAAVVVCEKAKSKYSKANEKLQNAIEQATSLQGTAANQVADAATIDQLTQAVTKAQNLKTVGGCSVLLSETTLRAHARSMSKQISNIKEQTKAVTAAATAVYASKRALEVNKTTAALQKTIADAKTLLDGSAGQVADESTRDALAKAIDAAQKLLDGKSTDVTAMQNASKVISSTSDGVNKSVAEQTAANAQSNTNSNTNSNTGNGTTNRRYTYTWQFGPGSGNGVNGGGSTGGNNNGGSTGGNGDSTGNGNGGSTGGNGGSNDGNGGSTGGNGDSNGNGGSTGGNGGNGDSNDNGNGGSDGGNDNSDTGTAGE
ncbi:hypothetical protein GBA38_08030 [Bifidobacterium adolescentis]|uniref:hypothetical protein n=1 Tax=Bifidobacterium adolescentis TaxID=1680 RepID=UPI00125EB633|nr:hypothetical protein GBA60_07765 [Bifidobacterium adolescentis]KAB5642057.1 hypothetical protein GBA59_08100 [Bifidobacterium adolescentis]KAB5643043.1 hypothetical protein GBA58_08070 [Bifidobacterium adolescentis]KAB5646295.1 hypothetical protein GBA57_08030 [Bifidobacterium adolescentis]KAB5646783.1 hypothetical protein GBA61_08045 [Bifidobacterium adolescentis]